MSEHLKDAFSAQGYSPCPELLHYPMNNRYILSAHIIDHDLADFCLLEEVAVPEEK